MPAERSLQGTTRVDSGQCHEANASTPPEGLTDQLARAALWDAFRRWDRGELLAVAGPHGCGPAAANAADYLEPGGKSCEGDSGAGGRHNEVWQCGCRSRFCPRCCVGLGLSLRERLIPILETFTGLMMWTLTIDPELFESPELAYDYVRERRAISNLVRALKGRGLLHSDRYFYVVEWQKWTEMPHYHLLVDATFIDFRMVCEVWNRNRPGWAGPVEGARPGFGSVRFSAPEFENHIHAAHYACKYMIKHPEHGYPDWVLDRKGNTPRYGTSRGFWREPDRQAQEMKLEGVLSVDQAAQRADCSCQDCREGGMQSGDRRRRSEAIRERLVRCGTKAVLMVAEDIIGSSGEVRVHRKFLSQIPLSFADVRSFLGFPEQAERMLRVTDEQARALLALLDGSQAGSPATRAA